MNETEIVIPKDLDHCFTTLTEMLSDEEQQHLTTISEDCMCNYHMGFGMWIRNNWGLWSGGPLKEWFNEKGIFHADDMSGIILDSYWRYINHKPINLSEQIEFYKQYWKQQGDK